MPRSKKEQGGALAAVDGADRALAANRISQEVTLKRKLDKIGPDVFSVYERMREWQSSNRKASVMYWWQCGTEFRGIVERYTERNAGVLADALDVDKTAMREALRLVDVWPTFDDITGLMSRTNQRGQTLTWALIRRLISADLSRTRGGRTIRDLYIDKILMNNWTVADLDADLFKRFGNRKPGAGRKHGTPRDLGRLLDNWENDNRIWMTRNLEVYSVEAVERLYDEFPADQISPGLLEHFDRLEQQLGAHDDVVRRGRETIELLRATVERRLAQAAEGNGKVLEVMARQESASPALPAPTGRRGGS
jgi:hypothetical protein